MRDLFFSGLVGIGLSCCTAPLPLSSPPLKTSAQLEGFWQDQKQSDYFVAFEEGHYFASYGGQVRIAAMVLDISDLQIRLCEDGQNSIREISLDRQELMLHDPRTGEKRQLRRLSEKPRELSLAPLRIPAPIPVSAERVRQIEGELRRRVQADQDAQQPRFDAMWKSKQPPEQNRPFNTEDLRLIATKSENTTYLRTLISEVGWIDSQRFGSIAAGDAFLLTQHSKDLPLILAVLPKIKEEVESGGLQGESYALLYDRLQLLLGKRQRYGTRMGQDASGQPMVLPTEEPEEVDKRRKELGMTSLSEYVRLFGAKEVIFSSACRQEKYQS